MYASQTCVLYIELQNSKEQPQLGLRYYVLTSEQQQNDEQDSLHSLIMPRMCRHTWNKKPGQTLKDYKLAISGRNVQALNGAILQPTIRVGYMYVDQSDSTYILIGDKTLEMHDKLVCEQTEYDEIQIMFDTEHEKTLQLFRVIL